MEDTELFDDLPKNVLGTPLVNCSQEPLTGFFRDGYCRTNTQDVGEHTVCAVMTEAFLQYSLSKGNDLVTPVPAFYFSGLQPGDYWCLCLGRWLEALEAGVAPPLNLAATHESVLRKVDMAVLKKYAA